MRFLYGLVLQWKLDIRSKNLLITCYIVPLLFFLLMGGIFTSIMPQMKDTLIQQMIIMGVSMGAFIGLPPSLAETYGSDVKKIYIANGVPLYMPLASMFISALMHIIIMCCIIMIIAPIIFDAALPSNILNFFTGLILYISTSLSIACILGLAVKSQSKLTMVQQMLFLPSIMLSGIMFPASMLPDPLEKAGQLFPSTWGFNLLMDNGMQFQNLWCLLMVFAIAVAVISILIKRTRCT